MAASRADPPSAIHMLDVTYDAATRREATPPANGSMAAKTEQEGRIVAVKAVQGIGLLDKENRWASRAFAGYVGSGRRIVSCYRLN